MRHQAGDLAPGPRRDRIQGRQRPREHRQRGPAVPVRSGPDVGAHRADLRRSPALDRRLDDRRGDRHRAPEARHRGARRLQGGDGQDGADRRLAPDPVDRRHGRWLHRRDGGAAQRGDPAPGQDRPGPGQPGRRRGRAGLAAQAGRVRPPDRGRARRSTRPRSTRPRRRRPRPARSPRPTPSGT